MNLILNVWRQASSRDSGRFERVEARDINPDASFLEMLDLVNEGIVRSGGDPIAFDSDCREGICGSCGFMINGIAHGPEPATTVCQLHMRHFKDGDELWLEPWRATSFAVIKDLSIDRGGFDRIIQAGGYISVRTGSAPEANEKLVPKANQELAMDAAECIACGACVAACPNASAMLFTAAKISHLNLLPQGQPERYTRVVDMIHAQDEEFGHCTWHGACQNACPKGISINYIARAYKDYIKAMVRDPGAMD